MGVFSFLMGPDIHEGLEQYDVLPDARLIDVRTEHEYRMGHIPGSENIPVDRIESILELTQDREVPLFVYCRSGARSRRAADELARMGFVSVTNLGGILAYRGTVEKSA